MRRIFIIVALSIAAVVGYVLWRPPPPLAVGTATVERGVVVLTVVNSRAGSVVACRRARLSPPVGGVVAELAVTEGDTVAPGDPLLTLWNEDLAARLALARQQVRQARANARQACVLAEQAQRKARRVRRLHERGLAADERLDQALAQAKAQEAQCRALQAQEKVAQRQVAVARANLERTRLRAPFAGEVAEVNVEVGEYIAPTPPGGPTPPALDLIDRGCVYVEAPIDEVDAARVAVGLPVQVSLDAFEGRTFPARVSRVAPFVRAVEKQARTVTVRVEFAPEVDTTALRPGYSADVEIEVARHEGVLRIPTEAVLSAKVVWVLGSDGRLHRRRIETGLSNWRWTEVTSGLKVGERVALGVEENKLVEGRRAVAKEVETQ